MAKIRALGVKPAFKDVEVYSFLAFLCTYTFVYKTTKLSPTRMGIA